MHNLIYFACRSARGRFIPILKDGVFPAPWPNRINHYSICGVSMLKDARVRKLHGKWLKPDCYLDRQPKKRKQAWTGRRKEKTSTDS